MADTYTAASVEGHQVNLVLENSSACRFSFGPLAPEMVFRNLHVVLWGQSPGGSVQPTCTLFSYQNAPFDAASLDAGRLLSSEDFSLPVSTVFSPNDLSIGLFQLGERYLGVRLRVGVVTTPYGGYAAPSIQPMHRPGDKLHALLLALLGGDP